MSDVNDNRDDSYESVPLRQVGEASVTYTRDNRDDTTPPGNGPYGEPQARCERTHWEPFPLYAQFDMPPARATLPVFVPANLVTALIEAHRRGDRDGFALALDRLADAVDPPNNNSGARAPIQGQG